MQHPLLYSGIPYSCHETPVFVVGVVGVVGAVSMLTCKSFDQLSYIYPEKL
jgi:hypothetical protein